MVRQRRGRSPRARNSPSGQIEFRWDAGDVDRSRKEAAELVALSPDVILALGGSTVASLLQATRAVPIVFVHVPDPVGAGFVNSLARPGGNATVYPGSNYDISANTGWSCSI